MPLTAIAFWLTYAAGICGAVLYPAVGVALYVLVYHVNPESQWWGGSFIEAGLRPSMTVAVATAIGMLLRRPRLDHGARQFPTPALLMLALFAYALLSVTWAEQFTPRTVYLAEKLIKVAIFVLMLVRCIRTPTEYVMVWLSWITGVAYISYEAAGGGGLLVAGRLTAGLGGPDFGESSGLAVHLVASLPLLGALFFQARAWWGRGLALVAGALTVNAIVLTRTRNALFGLAAMCVCAVFWLPRGYRAKGLLAIGVGTVLAVQLTDPGWWERMQTISNYQADGSAAGRLVYWNAAIDLCARNLHGIGLGQFESLVQRYTPGDENPHSAHSTFFECLAELGVPGLTLLVLVLFTSLRQVRRTRKLDARQVPLELPLPSERWRLRFHLGWHAMALQSALVGYVACGLFTTRLWSEGFWVLLGMGCALRNIAAQQEFEQPQEVAPCAYEPAWSQRPACEEPG